MNLKLSFDHEHSKLKLNTNMNITRNFNCNFNFNRRVLDMARTSVICETPEVVRHLTDSLKKCPEVGHIGRMKNGFGSSAVGRGGYRDIKVNLRPSAVAHYVEVQVGHGN